MLTTQSSPAITSSIVPLMIIRRSSSSVLSPLYKPRTSKKKHGKRINTDKYKWIPRVPSTEFLSPSKLFKDGLFSGYRPLPMVPSSVYPLPPNPHNPVDPNPRTGYFPPSSSTKEDVVQISSSTAKAAGPTILASSHPSLRTSLWSSSAAGLEHYPEMDKFPKSMVENLKPFQQPELPIEINIITGEKINNSLNLEMSKKSRTDIETDELEVDSTQRKRRKKKLSKGMKN